MVKPKCSVKLCWFEDMQHSAACSILTCTWFWENKNNDCKRDQPSDIAHAHEAYSHMWCNFQPAFGLPVDVVVMVNETLVKVYINSRSVSELNKVRDCKTIILSQTPLWHLGRNVKCSIRLFSAFFILRCCNMVTLTYGVVVYNALVKK